MKLPDVIRTRLEQECEAGEKAGGTTVHDGRTKIHAADIRYLLGMIDAPAAQEPVALGRIHMGRYICVGIDDLKTSQPQWVQDEWNAKSQPLYAARSEVGPQEPVALTVWADKDSETVRWLRRVPIGTHLYAKAPE